MPNSQTAARIRRRRAGDLAARACTGADKRCPPAGPRPGAAHPRTLRPAIPAIAWPSLTDTLERPRAELDGPLGGRRHPPPNAAGLAARQAEPAMVGTRPLGRRSAGRPTAGRRGRTLGPPDWDQPPAPTARSSPAGQGGTARPGLGRRRPAGQLQLRGRRPLPRRHQPGRPFGGRPGHGPRSDRARPAVGHRPLDGQPRIGPDGRDVPGPPAQAVRVQRTVVGDHRLPGRPRLADHRGQQPRRGLRSGRPADGPGRPPAVRVHDPGYRAGRRRRLHPLPDHGPRGTDHHHRRHPGHRQRSADRLDGHHDPARPGLRLRRERPGRLGGGGPQGLRHGRSSTCTGAPSSTPVRTPSKSPWPRCW